MIDIVLLTSEDVGRKVSYKSDTHGHTYVGEISDWDNKFVCVRFAPNIHAVPLLPEHLSFDSQFSPEQSDELDIGTFTLNADELVKSLHEINVQLDMPVHRSPAFVEPSGSIIVKGLTKQDRDELLRLIDTWHSSKNNARKETLRHRKNELMAELCNALQEQAESNSGPLNQRPDHAE